MRAYALLRYDVAEARIGLSGAYLGIGEAADAAEGFGANGSWREREEEDLVAADWVQQDEKATWYIVPAEVHPARDWWGVRLAARLLRDCLRAIAKGGAR